MHENTSQEQPEAMPKTKRYWFTKITVSLLLLVAVLLMIMLLTVYWFSSTNKGLQHIISWINNSVTAVTIQHAEGRLFGPLLIEGLSIQTESFDYSQKTLRVDWSPAALLKRKIVVNSLTLDGVELTLANTPENNADDSPTVIPESIKLPLGFASELKEIVLTDIVFNSGDTYQIDRIALVSNTDENQYQLEYFSVESDWIDLTLNTVLGTQKPFAIEGEAELKLSIEKLLNEQYADVHTSFSITGNTDALKVIQSIKAPYNTSLDLQAESLLDDLSLDLKFNLDQTELAKISSSLPPYSLSTELNLRGSPSTFSANSHGDITIDKNSRLNYTLQSSNQANIVEINQFTVSPWPNIHNSLIELKGRIDLSSDDITVALDSKWNDLLWPIGQPKQGGKIDFFSPQGALKIAGSAKQLLLEMDALVGENGSIDAMVKGNDLNLSERSIDALIEWENLQYPQVSEESLARYISQKGRFTLKGNQADYQLKLNSDFSTSVLSSTSQPTKSPIAAEFIEGKINLHGKGTQTSFDLESLSIKSINNGDQSSQLTGSGNAQFNKDFSVLAAQLNLQGENINPALLLSDWPGDLDITMQLDAEKNGDDLGVAINTLRIDGQLREYPLMAEAQARLNNQVLDIQSLSLISGDSVLDVAGRFAQDSLNGRWNLVSKNLANFYPDAKGAVTAFGELRGKLQAPIIKTQLKAEDIVIDTLSIDNVEALVDVDLSSQNSQSNIDIRVNDILANNFPIDTINAELVGSLDDHRLQLTTDTAQGQFENTLSGSYRSNKNNFEWQFLIEKLALVPSQFKPWQLENYTQGKVNPQGIQLEPLCIQSGRNAVCLDANASNAKNTIDANIDIRQLDYQYFSPLLGDAIAINSGGISGNAKLSLFNHSLTMVDLALTTQQGTIQIPFIESTEQENTESNNLLKGLLTSNKEDTAQTTQWASFLLDQGNIEFKLNKNQLDLSAELPFAWALGNKAALTTNQVIKANSDQGLSLSLQTKGSADLPLNEQTLSGQLNLNAYDLDPIITLIPQLSSVPSEQDKAFRALMDIGGVVNEPQIKGSIALENLALTVKDAGITLSNIQSDITSTQAGLIDFNAEINSKPTKLSGLTPRNALPVGQLAIKGAAQLKDKPALRMTIEANQFQLLNTTELQAVVSPLIYIKAVRERIDINGELNIPSALFAPNKIDSSAINASSDQVIVSDNPQDNPSLPDVYANVRVVLGDDVKVESFGFKGDINGAMTAVARPNSPTTGVGELNILNGEYRAYGQGLVIERGQILFSGGNIEQPGVDIKAKRNPAENLTVGIIAQGDIREPDFTLFSEPAMTQTEQLSWLILGKSFSESSGGEGNALSQLALSIGLSSGDDFLQNFNGQLGLDSIAIETGSGEAGAFSDNEQAALTLGKYLTPKLYLSYGIGLFDALDTIKLEYLINPTFKIATESSSAASGADIIYNIGSD